MITCQLLGENSKKCGNKFIKTGGTFYFGKWFCSEKCSGEDEECSKLKEMEQAGLDDSEEVEIDL